jgi:RNA polymerase sigma factor (sigma-70 family)
LNSIKRIARIQKRIISGIEDIDIEERLSKLKRLANSYDPETELLKSEFWMRISAALECLTPHQQEILCRRYMQMEPIEAISSDMGITRNAVRQVLFRAKRIFRAKLKESGLPEEEVEEYLSLLTPPPRFILEP